jgi:hypothetical protein
MSRRNSIKFRSRATALFASSAVGAQVRKRATCPRMPATLARATFGEQPRRLFAAGSPIRRPPPTSPIGRWPACAEPHQVDQMHQVARADYRCRVETDVADQSRVRAHPAHAVPGDRACSSSWKKSAVIGRPLYWRCGCASYAEAPETQSGEADSRSRGVQDRGRQRARGVLTELAASDLLDPRNSVSGADASWPASCSWSCNPRHTPSVMSLTAITPPLSTSG